jgi:hypothetical protein
LYNYYAAAAKKPFPTMRTLCMIFIICCLSSDLVAQTEIPGNDYTPAGRWIVFSTTDNSIKPTKLFVPTFITEANPFILKEIGYQLLRFSRRQVYKELFRELLLQTTSQDIDFEYGVSKQISSQVAIVGGEIKIFNELSVAKNSGLLFRNLPDVLGAVSAVFAVDAKVTKAEGDAISAYTSLSAFAESRYQLINNMVSNASYIDPELEKGLYDAINELHKMKDLELKTFKEQEQNSALLSGTTQEFLKSILDSQFGSIISTMVGGEIIGTALEAALPGAWFYQLARGFESDKAEACIVLLSTLDRLIFENQYSGNSATNRYLFIQMRSHLSFMIKLAADVYYKKVTSMSKNKQTLRTWINGFPYYDLAELAVMKQNAINEVGIKSISESPKNTVVFTASEVNSILKNSEFEFGFITGNGYTKIRIKDGSYIDYENDRCVYLSDYCKTTFTGHNNEYLVSFQAGTCGNSGGSEHILVIINSDKTIRKIDAIYSLSNVIIENNSLIVFYFQWEKYDSHCCPTWEIKCYYKWDGMEFKLIKEEKKKKSY